jgi:MYXO-CTERM domain-containing protein
MIPLITLLAALSTGASAITREEVLDNAALYASHVWTSTSHNQYAECTDDAYESGYPPGSYVGLPYDWGGYVTIDEFDQQIDDGYGAGGHSWNGILSCTTGVDCSGFVSKTWDTTHYTTSSFADGATHEITYAALERGDAVNDAGSHVVLWTYETDAGWPVFYEASGGASRAHLNSTSGWSYLDGYQPIRFDSITNGPSTGTVGAPHDITTFPYSDFRWTAGAASDSIDRYSCATSTDESGPEVLYRFQAASAGTLHVVVSDDVGVDVDVHVLTAPDGDHCLARNDSELSVEVDPGEIWISVDTYVSGHEFPGPFLLSATFDGTVGELEDTDPVDDTAADSGDAPADTDEAADTDLPADEGRDHVVPRSHRLGGAEPEGCGCTSAPDAGTAGLLGLGLGALALGVRRRRR